MNAIEQVFNAAAAGRIGWTLVHFVWEGAAIAALFAILLSLLRQRSPNTRYVTGCLALLILVTAPVATFFMLPGYQAPAVPAQNGLVARGATAKLSPVCRFAFASPVPISSLDSPSAAFVSPSPIRRFAESFQPALPWLVAVWMLGVFSMAIRLLIGWQRVRRMKISGTEPVDSEWERKLAHLASRIPLSRPVRVLKSSLAEVPTVIGWLRPIILMPASTLTGLSPQQIEAILAHELAHVRRHDFFINILQSVVEALLFYHPAVWWISNRVRQEREHCCDDWALKLCGDRVAYARALATLEELRQGSGLVMAARGGSLLERIRRIVGSPDADSSPPSGWRGIAPVAVAILMATFACCWLVYGAEPTPMSAVATFLEQLDSSDYAIREEATKQLTDLWEEETARTQVQSANHKAQKEKKLEVEDRTQRILAEMEIRRALGKDLVAKIGRESSSSLRSAGAEEALDLLTSWFSDEAKKKSWGLDQAETQTALLRAVWGKFQSEEERAELDELVSEFDLQGATRLYAEELKSENATLRASAASSLGALDAKENIPNLVGLLGDKDEGVRVAAVDALGGMDAKEQAKPIAGLLQDPVAEVRAAVVMALAQLEAREFTTDLVAMLKDKDDEVQAAAASALGDWGVKDCAPEIGAWLKGRDQTLQSAALEYLGKLGTGGKQFAPNILLLLKAENVDIEVQKEAVKILVRWGDKEFIPPIAALLKAESLDTRLAAASALGDLGAKEYIGPIAALLKAPADELEDSVAGIGPAIKALGQLGAKDLAGSIATFLQHEDADTRAAAVLALGRLNAHDYRENIEALIEDEEGIWLEDDTEKTVADVARQAISMLDGTK